MPEPLYILGAGMHPWGKWGRDFTEYGVVAARAALAEAGLDWRQIQLVAGADTIRNGYPGFIAGSTFAQKLGWNGVPVSSSYAACASGSQALQSARAHILAGFCDVALVIGADTPLNIPSVAPGLPLSPERSRGVFWDFQGPFGVMGATGQFGLIQTRYRHEHELTDEQLAKVEVTTRFHASLHPGAIYRTPITVDDYLNSRVLSSPLRLLDCVPIVNGGMAYVVTSAATARKLTDRPVYLLGFGEANNYYRGSRSRPGSAPSAGWRWCRRQRMTGSGVA